MRLVSLFPALIVELLLLTQAANSAGVRTMFLFKDVLKSNTTALTTNGFTHLVMFGVGVVANGDIMYYSNTPGSVDTLIASNGSYVGGDALASKVRSLKSGADSSVKRVEICMNAQNIAALMRSPGPGPDTRVYRNFAALKEAWNLDAVNNDDESIYDVTSTVTFAKMLGAIGYKYSIAPYTRSNFWVSVKNQLNSLPQILDKVYLQCYDGGANNDPIAWQQALGMKVVPLLWVVNDSKPNYGQTPAQARSRFAGWQGRGGGLDGGGYWNDFDIEKMGLSYSQYGDVLESVFP